MADNDKTFGGRGNRDNQDVHSTGRVPRPNRNNDDVHSTGRASRPGRNAEDVHATGKASRPHNDSGHTTAKGNRGQGGTPRPFEKKNNFSKELNATFAGDNGAEWPDFFELDGIKYKNEGILSNSSGEAIIFTVSRSGKKYALKVYYYDPEHRPNHAVLEKIKQLGGSGLLVNIVSHGLWTNPERPNEQNDYELMDFCEGGSLDGVILSGDEKTLTEVAVRMASAIDFLAKHGILHRDIKPANFFYADKNKTQIVLADFGISVECPQGNFVKIDEMRSPVYAAPEFYTNVPGEPAEVGVESDYFSLGVSLLCLWMGKEKLAANESQLLRSKLNETLPMPDDMSGHMASLIKALTRLKMSERATFDDIKRWVKGESLETGDATDVNSDFHVVFNSAKKQIANSPCELAHYLLEDKALGKKYLYSGRVTRWLEETNRNEIAVNVEEIVEKVYPANQDAGLMAVAYMLDPALDYVDPSGKHFTDPAEIAIHAFDNRDIMAQEVLDPESGLMVYMHALKLDKTIESLRKYLATDEFKNIRLKEDKEIVATYYLAVLLRNVPFPIYIMNGWKFVETVQELLDALHEEEDIYSLNAALLKSDAFIAWLAYRDPALAGKIRMLHDESNDDEESIYYQSDSEYRIVYELNPAADYWFSTDTSAPDRIYTIPEIGGFLNSCLNKWVAGEQCLEDFEWMFEDMAGNRLGDYLRARGEGYMKFLSWNKYCMDTEDEENIQKAGPYNPVIGTYKSTAGFLGTTPTYVLDGKTLTDPSELKNIPKDKIKTALGGEEYEIPDFTEYMDNPVPMPWLDAWLAVFYQENPKLDLSPKFTYEKETARYIEFIYELDPENYYAERYHRAISQIDNAEKTLDKSENKIKRKRNFFLIAAGIPTLIMLIGSWFLDAPEVNPISGHFWSAFLICAICCFIAAWTLFESFFGGIIPGIIGGLVCAGFAWAGFAWFPSVLYVLSGIILIAAACVAIGGLFNRREVNDGIKIKAGSFQFRQLDALYFTFRQDDDELDSAVADLAIVQGDEDKTTRENIGFTGCIWASLAWMMFLIWFNATPQLSGSHSWAGENQAIQIKKGQWVLGTWIAKYPSSSTKIVCNIDSIVDGKKIYGTMIIAGQAPVEAQGVVNSDNDTLPKSFEFRPVDGTTMKQNLSATFNKRDMRMEGHYYDRKGIMHQIVFISTPLQGVTTPNEKQVGTKTKEKKNVKVTETVIQEQTEEMSVEETPAESDNLLENEKSPVSELWKDTM